MKILINTADLHPDERVFPEHEIARDCSGGNLHVYMSDRNSKRDDYVLDAMYSIWMALPKINGIEDCDWGEDIAHPLLVVVKDDFDWYALANELETKFKFLKNTKSITMEFQFENFSYMQGEFRNKLTAKESRRAA